MNTLKDVLQDWTDFDAAAHELAIRLGLVGDSSEEWLRSKGVYWSANPLGDALWKALQSFVSVGILEYDEEELRYRWSPDYGGGEQKNTEPHSSGESEES